MSIEKSIIVVSGLPRSGTSLMMKMLDAAGLPLMIDSIREADDDNPKGYFELEEAKQLKDGHTGWLSEAKGKAVKIVAPLLRFISDEFDYKILFMRRAMTEILASQKQMLIRRGKDPNAVPDEMMAKVFEKQMEEVLEWMKGQANISFLEIAYSGLIENAAPLIEDIRTFLDLALDQEKMAQVVDSSLYRQRAS